MPDAVLVERARRGDAEAFEALVRRHYRAAFSVALSQLGDVMDAEDVVQDAFIRALERLDDCIPERFLGWLLTIVRNRAHNYRDYRRVRASSPLDAVAAESSLDTAREAEQGQLRTLLEEALTTLTPTQREVALLHDMEGWKHREIAEALELSEVTSRQHLFNARRLLRERLGANALKEYSNDD